MRVEQISTLPEIFKPEKTTAGGGNFNNVFTDFIGDVNKMQGDSVTATNDFIVGGNTELHDVMIAGEKARTSLELLMEIRNKAVDMYKELTRIQI